MPKYPSDPSPEPANDAMRDLLRARGFEASPAPAAAVPVPPKTPGAIDLASQGKLVVRRERKGRGGKTVTLVQGLAPRPAEIEALARALRKALGIGSTAEDGEVVLQGDVADRAAAWLQAHGAKKVVRGT
jgi:translation initiation factor 1